MKKEKLLRVFMVVVLFTFADLSSLKAQFYQNSHLFIGLKPSDWANIGSAPSLFIGPEWGLEYYEMGLNVRRPSSTYGGGNYKIFLADSSRVGIRRKPITYTLEVDGSVWTSNEFLLASDKRLKRNISNLSDIRYGYLNKILLLEGYSYDKQISSSEGSTNEVAKMFKQGKIKPENITAALESMNSNNPAFIKEFGFIAQEVKELFPELVEEGSDGILSINYIGLIPVLVEGIKDLQNKIIELKGKIEDKGTTRRE